TRHSETPKAGSESVNDRHLKSALNAKDTLCIGALLHRQQIFDWKHHALVLISYVKNLRNRRSLLLPLRGFTLAETLLTLGIIGVVAALVIPQLKQTIDNRELVSKYLKTNNVISNAYKETEAVSTIQLYSQSPDKFKELLESHLKILSSDCIQDVCLTDGSSYSYECDETKCTGIIIDTNGDKKPNSAGKDRYRMLVTNKGLIAQGESEYCGTIDGGLDCGKYILTYHKLFDGLINNCTAYDNGQCSQCENGYQNNGNSCKDIRENTCATYSGTTCTKCTSENLLVDGECISMTSLHCKASDDGKTCKTCNPDYHNEDGTCAEGYVENCSVYDGEKCQTCIDGKQVYTSRNMCFDGKIVSENGYETPVFKVNLDGQDVYMSAVTNVSASDYYIPNGDYDTSKWPNGYPNAYAAAEKYCVDRGMSLPTPVQALSLYDQRGTSWIPTTVGDAGIWTSSSNTSGQYATAVCFDGSYAQRICGNDGVGKTKVYDWSYGFDVMCVSN
ncbi:type II secretion system protein, partial [bacterium]|nr:type II secretion system protein [bacterium]